MRFSLRRGAKALAAVVSLGFVYYFFTGFNVQPHLSPIHVAGSHPKLGKMKTIEEFWTPEQELEHDPGEPGGNGEPLDTQPGEEHEKERSYGEYGFNQFISDKISLHRSIRDTRHEA